MATIGDENLPLTSDFTYQQYAPPVLESPVPIVEGGTVVITTINGATGPSITISGGVTGYSFNTSGGTITLTVSSAATVRSSIGAAASGANADINSFTALTGNTGFAAWSGTADKTTHATYPTTVAAVAYDQTQMQGIMDKMKEITEAFKAVEDALLSWGGLEV